MTTATASPETKNSDIEFIRAPYEDLLGTDLFFDDERHELCDTMWPHLEWLRRQTGRDLVIYKHRRTNLFVLAQILNHPRDGGPLILNEIDGLERAPSDLWPYSMAPSAMKQRLRDAREVYAEIAAYEAQKQAEDRQKREDSITERNGYTKHLRGKGMEVDARAYETGATPFAGTAMVGQDKIDEAKEEMKSLAKMTR